MNKNNFLFKIIPVVMFFVLAGVTFFISNLFYRSLLWKSEQDLNTQASEISSIIGDRINSHIDVLYSARGLFLSSVSVERDEWKNFILGTKLEERHPGFSSMVFIERVLESDKENFINEVKADASVSTSGYSNFTITPDVKKSEYLVGKYVEPEEGRVQVLGYDFSSEVARNRALSIARDQNIPTATDVLKLITTQKYGANIILPIYKNGTAIDTQDSRRGNLIGFVMATLRVDDFFNNVITTLKANYKDVTFEVYDIDNTGNEFLFFSYNPNNYSLAGTNVSVVNISVANRNWILKVYKKNSLASDDKIFLGSIAGGGMLISFLISILLFVFISGRNQAIKIAEGMTASLKESEEKFKSVTESAKDAIVMMDEKGLIVLWNKAAEQMFGYTFAEVQSKELHKIVPVLAEHQNKKDNLNAFFKTGLSPVLGKSIELPVKNKKGEEFTIELTVSRAQLHGEWHAIGIMRDITIRKKQEDELKERTDELERINRYMVGRELKMLELKEEVENMTKKKK